MSSLNVNKVIFAGHLCAEPELRQTQSGKSVSRFTLAINRQQKQGEEQQSDFITCIAWEKRAEFVSQYFHKGSAAFLSGRMATRNWTDDKNEKHYAVECIVDDISFVDSKSDAQSAYGAPQQAQNASRESSTVQSQASATPPPAQSQYVPQGYAGTVPSPNGGFRELGDDESLPF